MSSSKVWGWDGAVSPCCVASEGEFGHNRGPGPACRRTWGRRWTRQEALRDDLRDEGIRTCCAVHGSDGGAGGGSDDRERRFRGGDDRLADRLLRRPVGRFVGDHRLDRDGTL